MKLKNLLLATVCLVPMMAVSFATKASEHTELKKVDWVFDGAMGKFDSASIQRGYQVYKQVCAACHSMHGLSYRNLSEVGFSEAEVKAIAGEYKVMDGPNETGEMFERPARPSDKFVKAFPNEQAARAANGGAYPPDLTLMAKARHDGPNYIYSLLTGYTTAPAGHDVPEGKYYNPYYPNGNISMPPPLSEGAVTYQDGTQATPEQMAHDVVNYLQWAASPEMESRKGMGIKVLSFIAIATVLLFIAMKRIWARVK